MTSARDIILQQIARCESEQAEINARADRETLPAWLVTLGMEDREAEKRFLAEKLKAVER